MFVKNKNIHLGNFHQIKGIIYQPELRTKFFDIREKIEYYRPTFVEVFGLN